MTKEISVENWETNLNVWHDYITSECSDTVEWNLFCYKFEIYFESSWKLFFHIEECILRVVWSNSQILKRMLRSFIFDSPLIEYFEYFCRCWWHLHSGSMGWYTKCKLIVFITAWNESDSQTQDNWILAISQNDKKTR